MELTLKCHLLLMCSMYQALCHILYIYIYIYIYIFLSLWLRWVLVAVRAFL